MVFRLMCHDSVAHVGSWMMMVLDDQMLLVHVSSCLMMVLDDGWPTHPMICPSLSWIQAEWNIADVE